MRSSVLRLLAIQVVKRTFKNKAVLILMALVAVLMIYAFITSMLTYSQQTKLQANFQREVRKHWEEMPDKHPHRMAHYGFIAFRTKNPLSVFDFGSESYTGNAVFLEAHKQNSVNFSEASFSTGLLRFGEIHLANILQLLVPLVLFFIGFELIALDRENNTLKLLLSQGCSWKEIIFGRTLGLVFVAFTLLLPAFLMLGIGLIYSDTVLSSEDVLRFLLLFFSYSLYLVIISTTAVLVSALAKKAKIALIGLLGVWLLFAIILPRTTQSIGAYMYPSPSRIAFEAAIEKDILKFGDSHDPNDPYFKRLKDSVLIANKVTSIEQLPFNYSGFQMREGERLSSMVYNQHQAHLLDIYQLQNNVTALSGFINPFVAIKNISMALSGTDFQSYVRFQEQTEAYRYRMAQHMNDLQIKLISNKKLTASDKPYKISSEYWKAFPDFHYQGLSASTAAFRELSSFIALLLWFSLLILIVNMLSEKLKAI